MYGFISILRTPVGANCFRESSDHLLRSRSSAVGAYLIGLASMPHMHAIVEVLFTQFEGYVFSVRGPGQSMHGVGCLPWSYGPPDDTQRLTGADVGVTKDGKLTALYVFIDSPSQK